MIEIQGLVRRYGDFPAVSGLSLSIPGGQVFGLLGPNGAGKSTIFRILSTLIRPTSGSVRIGGFDVSTQPEEVRRIIGYVPENAELYESLSGIEFLELVADLHRLNPTDAEARRRPLLEAFALAEGWDSGLREEWKSMGSLRKGFGDASSYSLTRYSSGRI